MIKVCSFLPAATQMIYDMGLQDHLYGVTFECPEKSLKEKPVVVRCAIEGKKYSSREIDTLFAASKQQGKELYTVDEALLTEIAPDIIFTQDLCDIWQIDIACTTAAAAKLKKPPLLISITPQSLDDVFNSATIIARALGKAERAGVYLKGLHQRIGRVVALLSLKRTSRIRVSLMEWMEPIYNCGHWIPHQIEYAGGGDGLSNPAGDSRVTPWEKIITYDPEVLVIAPCGFKVKRTLEEIHLLTERAGWQNLKAVKNNRVYIADFHLFTQSSAATLVEGIELLAGLFHPNAVKIPEKLKKNYKLLDKPLKIVK